MGISAGVPVRSDDVLRQSKTSIIVFTSLVCRAAIEGGFRPRNLTRWGIITFSLLKMPKPWTIWTRLR